MWLEARRLAGGDDARPYNLRTRASTCNNRLRSQKRTTPSSHKFPLPYMLHNPLRGVSMGQAPVMKTPSAAIAHIQLKTKLGTKPSGFFKNTHSRGLTPTAADPKKKLQSTSAWGNSGIRAEVARWTGSSAEAPRILMREREGLEPPKSDFRFQ